MGNIKFQFVTILLIVGVGLVGYLALRSLKNPETYVRDNEEVVGDVLGEGEGEPVDAEPVGTGAEPDGEVKEGETTTPTTPTTPTTTSSQHATLIANLEKMKTAGTIYKIGSKGDEVGYIQEALNIINGTTNAVDKDYGNGTSDAVKKFQEANSITPISGMTAGKTLTKMIEIIQSKG